MNAKAVAISLAQEVIRLRAACAAWPGGDVWAEGDDKLFTTLRQPELGMVITSPEGVEFTVSDLGEDFVSMDGPGITWSGNFEQWVHEFGKYD